MFAELSQNKQYSKIDLTEEIELVICPLHQFVEIIYNWHDRQLNKHKILLC
jgi:hypothetical protein